MIEFNKRNIRSWSIMGINPSIWSVAFSEISKKKENIAVLTADLERYSGLERIYNSIPSKCFNLGIAEQNMVGVAAGMALEGIQTFMTTYAPFMSFRCADHVRHFMGNLHLNMKAIGSAAGLSAGLSGLSLLALSDLAFFRSIPGIVVLSPADCTEAVKMMLAISEIDDPVYMRFCGTTNIPVVYQDDYKYEIGKAVLLNSGDSIAIIATGTDLVKASMDASKIIIEQTGVNVTVVNMHTICPIDTQILQEIAKTHNHIISVEEHFEKGGLGSAIAEFISSLNTKVQLHIMAVSSLNMKLGSREYLLNQFGLTPEGIANNAINIIKSE